jgi:hypothetical protein
VSQDHVWLHTCPAVTSTIVATLCHVSKEQAVNCLCLYNERLLMWMSHSTAMLTGVYTASFDMELSTARWTMHKNALGHLPDEVSLCLVTYTGRKAMLHI